MNSLDSIYNTRIIFVIIYLVIDSLYVFNSKDYYKKFIGRVQSKPQNFEKKGIYSAIGLSYIFLMVGWFILVSERLSKHSTVLDILRITIPYALVVYGVFNGTLFVMFDKWDVNVSLRDTLWGVTSISILSIIYVQSLKIIS